MFPRWSPIRSWRMPRSRSCAAAWTAASSAFGGLPRCTWSGSRPSTGPARPSARWSSWTRIGRRSQTASTPNVATAGREARCTASRCSW